MKRRRTSAKLRKREAGKREEDRKRQAFRDFCRNRRDALIVLNPNGTTGVMVR